MSALLEKTRKYLSNFHSPSVEVAPMDASALPFHLRERYSVYRTKIFDKTWALAMESPDWEAGTPKEYRQQLRLLEDAFSLPIVLVLTGTSSTLRNRLVKMAVPFVVPGTQLFLPMSTILLTETYAAGRVPSSGNLTPAAQVVLLHQILKGELDGRASKDVAEKLGYSKMMITKARAELEAQKLCESERVGKETRFKFCLPSRDLWEAAQGVLSTPVQKIHWVQWDAVPDRALSAGMTGLGEYTMIDDDDVPTFAIERKEFRRLLESGEIRGWADQNGAHARLESWKYAPLALSEMVAADRLSLFLALRADQDPRVQGELRSMLEGVQWR